MRMRAFSDGEFRQMTVELLCDETPRFDTLCLLAEKTLRRSVCRWCAEDPALAGGHYEDDVMQETLLRLIRCAVSGFLLRDGPDGEVNDDPDGFCRWMFTVAHNVWRDLSNRVRKLSLSVRGFREGEEELIPDDPADADTNDAGREILRRAVAVVLTADAHVCKVLTWLAQCLFMIRADLSRIRANDLILREFENKTLYEMRDMLVDAAAEIPWLSVSEEQFKKIDRELDRPFADDRKTGEIRYKEFFMKKGGKATISDWVNRINSLIRRVCAK